MTSKEFLQLLRDNDFHIGDGMGDSCSGYDDEGMEKAATAILAAIIIDLQPQTELNANELRTLLASVLMGILNSRIADPASCKKLQQIGYKLQEMLKRRENVEKAVKKS